MTLVLRPPRAEDVDQRLALGNAPDIMRSFGADPYALPALTRDRAKSWVDAIAAHPHAWIVEHDGKFLGEVRLDAVDRDAGQARLAVGFYDPSKLGQGLGRQAVRLALAHAFEKLGLTKIWLRVLEYNQRAIRCYRACGFVETGREANAVCLDGKWHDDLIMEIHSSAWGPAPIKKTEK
jgi:RimJ/RimL family protein N-acetyltransferase